MSQCAVCQSVEGLGNANYKGLGHSEIVIHQPEEGVRYVVRRLMEREVVLLCACAQLQTCHRLVVANLVQAASGCEVTHLRESHLSEWVGQQLAEGAFKSSGTNVQTRIVIIDKPQGEQVPLQGPPSDFTEDALPAPTTMPTGAPRPRQMALF